MRLSNVWRYFGIFFILKYATTLKNDIELKKRGDAEKEAQSIGNA